MLGNRGNRSRYRREKSKKNAIILIICILIISVVVVGIKFIPKQDKENVQVTTNSDEEINSGDKEVTGNYQELESNILDN
ncbi:MAG: hypothetical protein E6176_03915, partial [Clostridium celatum]|nr:hypothetical protein [Clostridium celatum]